MINIKECTLGLHYPESGKTYEIKFTTVDNAVIKRISKLFEFKTENEHMDFINNCKYDIETIILDKQTEWDDEMWEDGHDVVGGSYLSDNLENDYPLFFDMINSDNIDARDFFDILYSSKSSGILHLISFEPELMRARYEKNIVEKWEDNKHYFVV